MRARSLTKTSAVARRMGMAAPNRRSLAGPGYDARVELVHRRSAARMRASLSAGSAPPTVFRGALSAVPAADRDAWIDLVLGIDGVPDDGPELPRGCTPYLPCSADTLLRMFD